MINWEKQWELHAPNFNNGFAYIKLDEYGGPNKSFIMKSGPGFGDLSHPTTRLMMRIMPKNISFPVIDLGCGCGVLSIAAKLRGAKYVLGIDNDASALEHAKLNAHLNNLKITFSKSINYFSSYPLILMNMISSEQKIAWNALPAFQNYTLILSGIPLEEKFSIDKYGTLIEKYELDGWLGFKIQKT